MDASPPLPLVALRPSEAGRVVAVAADDAERLAAEGLHPGDVVVVDARLPLGGPLVVRVGRVRIAIARSVAAGILVEPGQAA
jgi:Fe2+ transport system protein FeoA